MNAVYAGSFDPFTNGHLHVLSEASRIFEMVFVVIAVNPNKKRRLNAANMADAIKQICKANGLHNIAVAQTFGLIADFAKDFGAEYIIRGIRNGTDYDYEESMAKVNERLGIQTIFFRAGEYGYISSSMVMELASHGADISQYVPASILSLMQERK